MAQSKRAGGVNGEEQDVFLKTWTDSYAEVSKMWEDSYLKLHKPWIETTGDLFDKASGISKEDPAPKQYQEFYEEWMNAYREHFGKFYPTPPGETNRAALEKLLDGAEESTKLYKSWISELEENTKKTQKALKDAPDEAPDEKRYQECYDGWIKTYDKIYDEFLSLSLMENTKDILEEYSGVPDIYFGSFIQISKLWRESYSKLYEPWVSSVSKLSHKISELAAGDADERAYEEFYEMWMDTYRETYGKYLESMKPSREAFDTFAHSTDIYLNMYKSWITALEKMAEKTNQLSQESDDPEVSREFYVLWIKMYEKAFGSFFEDMPMEGPMKEMMEPVKMMAKINADTFARMSKMWVKQDFGSPGGD